MSQQAAPGPNDVEASLSFAEANPFSRSSQNFYFYLARDGESHGPCTHDEITSWCAYGHFDLWTPVAVVGYQQVDGIQYQPVGRIVPHNTFGSHKQLTVPAAPLLQPKRSQGTLSKWFATRNYGFITAHHDGLPVHCHVNALQGTKEEFYEGVEVEFEVTDPINGGHCLAAIKVALVPHLA